MRPNNNQNTNKNRSRGRSNNNGRKHVNPLSRNFESNGPDVKVRGNAAHIAEKYVQLARDAQASGDSVMAENYLQHAEHYYRIVSAAQPQGGVRPDGFGQDADGDYDDDDFGDTNNRFEPRFGQVQPQPQQQHVEAEQTQVTPATVVQAPAEPAVEQPEAAASASEEGEAAPRRQRERRPRRRPRTGGEGADAVSEPAGGPQTDISELPAFLTGGTAAAE